MEHESQLSSRERVLLALAHRDTDRVPIAMVCSGINQPTWGMLDEYLKRERGCDLRSWLDSMLDIRAVAPRYVGPPLKPDTDFWGVRRKRVQFGDGSYNEIDHYPLAAATTIDDLKRHTWPRTDWFDYEMLPEEIDRLHRDGGPRAIMALNCNVFESSWYMRGFEQALMDLAVEAELFDFILGKVADFFLEHARRTLEAARGGIDLIFTADDIGHQGGLLMSLDMWEKHIKPHHAPINRQIHELGARVIYHTDGAVMDAVPGLIDMGIDVLQALQFDAAGMDPRRLKETYGRQLCFEGGVSVQKTLPFGTADEVRAEVQNLITILGRQGGYILGPSHVIQAGTPVENILAMFDTALGFASPKP
ncbi:hypothetical protein HQ520_03650 [bacterium]|nr:hypothetical protein [bacterium]